MDKKGSPLGSGYIAFTGGDSASGEPTRTPSHDESRADPSITIDFTSNEIEVDLSFDQHLFDDLSGHLSQSVAPEEQLFSDLARADGDGRDGPSSVSSIMPDLRVHEVALGDAEDDDALIVIDELSIDECGLSDTASLQIPYNTAERDGMPPPNGGRGPGRSFSAYPHLLTPATARREQLIEIEIGFTDDRDPALKDAEKISLNDVGEDDECEVSLIPEGLDIDLSIVVKIPFRCNEFVMVPARIQANVKAASITAVYRWKGCFIGSATRIIAVEDDGLTGTDQDLPPALVELPKDDEKPDISVYLRRNETSKKAKWLFASPLLAGMPSVPVCTDLDETSELVENMLGELENGSYGGTLGWNALESTGQTIGDLIPLEFWGYLSEVERKLGRPAQLLFLTNEFYIPWELALVPPSPLDEAAPSAAEAVDSITVVNPVAGFLCTRTIMGRWIIAHGVPTMPRNVLRLERLTVVASPYIGLAEPLAHAMQEKEHMTTVWGAVHVEATVPAVGKLTEEPIRPGHFIQFAVHGFTTDGARPQLLLMACGGRISPGTLFRGSFGAVTDPRFAFVFLNACEVGAGKSLVGQASGFAGKGIRNGVSGFIAPLWKIHDADAFQFAKELADRALTGSQETVAEIIRDLRRKLSTRVGSCTPMSYVFYGHPGLRLENRAPRAVQPEGESKGGCDDAN